LGDDNQVWSFVVARRSLQPVYAMSPYPVALLSFSPALEQTLKNIQQRGK
jgi:hypothetical protein